MVLGFAMLALLTLLPGKGWAACLGIAVAIGMIAVGRGANLRGIPAPAALAIISAMALVSIAFAPIPAADLSQLWLLWGGIGGLCLVALWAGTPTRLLLAGAALSALGAALALVSPFVVNWFIEKKTFLPPAIYEHFPRLVSDTIHPNVMASLLVGLMFVPLAWAVRPPHVDAKPQWLARAMRGRFLWIACAFLMALVLFLTKSRGGYLAAVVGAAVLALLMARRRRWFVWVLAVALAIGIAAILWLPGSAPLVGLDDLEVLNTSSLAFRERIWHYAALLIGDFPFTGVGMRAFNDVNATLYGYQILTDPGAHSLFLQIALDLGIPGLLAFLALAVLMLVRTFRAYLTLKRPGDPMWTLAAGAIAGVVATLAHGFVDLAAWGTRGSFVLWCLLGLLAALSAYARGPGRDSRGADTAPRNLTANRANERE
jgi:putative inorganic carbon (HCO3(-)) transporter